MSILFLVGRRHGANHAMFEASALHRAPLPSHATYLSVESVRCRHGYMPQACASHAYSTSAGGWQITREHASTARADRAGRSSLGPTCARSSGAQGHCAQLGTRLQRADELSKVRPTVELEQDWSAVAGRQPLRHTVRFTWHGQKRVGGGSRMQGGLMAGLPGVGDSSRPCAPLDLPRSPARRAGSGRFTIGPRRMSLLCERTNDSSDRVYGKTWRRCVRMSSSGWRWRAAHRRAARGARR